MFDWDDEFPYGYDRDPWDGEHNDPETTHKNDSIKQNKKRHRAAMNDKFYIIPRRRKR